MYWTPICHSTAIVLASSTRSAIVLISRCGLGGRCSPDALLQRLVAGEALHQRTVDLEVIDRQVAQHLGRCGAAGEAFERETRSRCCRSLDRHVAGLFQVIRGHLFG
jgi:hypothetical protein